MTCNEAGHQVTIYEAAPASADWPPASRLRIGTWTLEKFYHHWFAGDKAMLGLIRELGWSDRVVLRGLHRRLLQEPLLPLDSYVEAFKFTISHFSLLTCSVSAQWASSSS